jgi:hypothetical protein
MTDENRNFSNDAMRGARAIAVYLFGSDERKYQRRVYGMAAKKVLPFFHMGREICLRKSTHAKRVAAEEEAAGPA